MGDWESQISGGLDPVRKSMVMDLNSANDGVFSHSHSAILCSSAVSPDVWTLSTQYVIIKESKVD